MLKLMKYIVFFIFAALMPALISSSGPARAETETPGSTPIALVEEAYLAHRKGNYQQAIEAYTRIIQRRGLTRRERAISYLLRGEARRDAGQLNEAVVDFTRALRQWPGYPQAHYFRGRVYERQGKLMEAYADIARAASLDPSRGAYETSLALLKKRMLEAGVSVRPGAPPEPVEPKVPAE